MYIDPETVEKCCSLDGVRSSQPDLIQAALCVNSWAALGLDIGFPFWDLSLRAMLRSYGLSGTVELCKEVYLSIISEDRNWYTSRGGELFNNCCNYLQSATNSNNWACSQSSLERLELLSQLLRYATRFTYIADTGTEDACFMKFIEANKSCYSAKDYRCRGISNPNAPGVWKVVTGDDGLKHIEHLDPAESEGTGNPRPGYSLIMAVKQHVMEMLGSKPVIRPDDVDGFFSDGSAAAVGCDVGPKTKESKIKALYSVENRFLAANYGYFLPNRTHCMATYRDRYLCDELEGSEMIAVPKNMTSKRLIKPEPVFRAFYASKVRKVIEAQIISTDHLEFLNWNDQSINRNLARSGSVSKGWATIDASSASDHQSRELTFMLLPEWIRPYVYNSLTDYVKIKGKRYRVRCLSTSGNQLTWLLLGVVMWAIADYGCSWYREPDGSYQRASAYGDDLVVPDVAYDTVCELLTLFGFVINDSKSYSNASLYRESCGGDFYAGYDVTPSYWKRGAVDCRDYPETMQFVCGMQHKLYSYPKVREYFSRAAVLLDPKITYSPVGWECDDLWDGNISVEMSINSQHRMLTSRNDQQVKYSQVLMDHQYFTFLKEGPKYDSLLSKKLGISMPYLDPNLVKEPTSRWSLVRPPYKVVKD
jgi:hypothetical protein